MAGMTPGRLAKELGIPKFEMFQTMQELRINAKRMDALLSTAQEDSLRRYYSNKAVQRQRSLARAAHEMMLRAQDPPPPPPRARVCPCCERRWQVQVDDLLATCPSCRSHVETADEIPDRKIARLEAHLAFLRHDRDKAYDAAHQSHEMKKAAFESRAKWRAALAEVVLDHDERPDGLCWCGHTLPCRTWLKLDEANRGIHRQVEKWSSWSSDRLDDFLYGDDRSATFVIDEDEPADDRPDATGATA